MSTLRQAAQQALETLENLYLTLSPESVMAVSLHRRITALIEALEADGQEPVAWMDREGDLYKMPEIKNWAPPHKMLYTAPPQRKPLSEEEIGKAWSVADGEHNASAAVKRRITRAIEQAHGIGEKT